MKRFDAILGHQPDSVVSWFLLFRSTWTKVKNNISTFFYCDRTTYFISYQTAHKNDRAASPAAFFNDVDSKHPGLYNKGQPHTKDSKGS